MNLWRLWVLFLMYCFSVNAFADTNENMSAEDLLGRIDLAVPQSPAFAVLGISPEEVVMPSSSRTLALALLNGLDARGNLQKGIAIDTKPYLLMHGENLTLKDYREDRTKRLLSRLQVSYATSSGKEDQDKADRQALSVRWTPWDKGDVMMDFNKDNYSEQKTLEGCFRNALVLNEETKKGITFNEDEYKNDKAIAAIDKELDVKRKACIKDSEKRNWNESSWDLGLAGFRVDDNLGQSENGYSFWSSLAKKMGKNAQLILHARIQENVLTPVGDTFELEDGWRAGGRLRYGSPKGAFILEAVHIENKENAVKNSGIQYLVGTEFRLRDDMWLQIALADRTGDLVSSNDDVIFSGQLRWAFSKNSLR